MAHDVTAGLGGRDRLEIPRAALEAPARFLVLRGRTSPAVSRTRASARYRTAQRARFRSPTRRPSSATIDVGLALGSGDRGGTHFHRKNYSIRLRPRVPIKPSTQPPVQRRTPGRDERRGHDVVGSSAWQLRRRGQGNHTGRWRVVAGGSRGAVVDFNRLRQRSWRGHAATCARPSRPRAFAFLPGATIVELGSSECDLEEGVRAGRRQRQPARPGEECCAPRTELKELNPSATSSAHRAQAAPGELYEAGEEFSTQTLN